jgi:hypothetical protein
MLIIFVVDLEWTLGIGVKYALGIAGCAYKLAWSFCEHSF